MKKFIISFLIFAALFSIMAFVAVFYSPKVAVTGDIPALRNTQLLLGRLNISTTIILYLSHSLGALMIGIFAFIGIPIAFLGIKKANNLLIYLSSLLLGGAVGLIVLRLLVGIYEVSTY